MRGLDSGLCFDRLEDGDFGEIFVDVCEDRADQGSELCAVHINLVIRFKYIK